MQRILLILLAMPMFLSSWSRDIKGVVLSDADSTAIIGAECLVKVGDKMIQGASTGADGSFEISTAEKGAMALEVSMTGYAPTEIVIESGAGNINVGRIYLNEAEALGEVTVTGKHMIDARGRTRLPLGFRHQGLVNLGQPFRQASASRSPCRSDQPHPECRRWLAYDTDRRGAGFNG